MPKEQPKTDPAKAFSELFADMRKLRRDLEWPEAAARKAFNETLGRFLKRVGAERPDLDLWGGKEAAPLHAYIVKTIVPTIVERAAAVAPTSRVVEPKALTDAVRAVIDDKAIATRVHQLIRQLAVAIHEKIEESICGGALGD